MNRIDAAGVGQRRHDNPVPLVSISKAILTPGSAAGPNVVARSICPSAISLLPDPFPEPADGDQSRAQVDLDPGHTLWMLHNVSALRLRADEHPVAETRLSDGGLAD